MDFGVNTVAGGAGNEGFFFGAGDRFNAADRIDGGGGGGGGNNDQLGPTGNYSSQIVFDADTIQNVEVIGALSAGDVRFGAEASGYSYNLKSRGRGNDVLTVGAGADMLFRGLGGDQLTVGCGNDIFI